MSRPAMNKYRAALRILQQGRDRFADELADTVLDRSDELLESPYLMTELVESQGSKLHYLAMLMAQLEQSAEDQDAAENRMMECDEVVAEEERGEIPPDVTRRRVRGRKRRRLPREQSSADGPHEHDPER